MNKKLTILIFGLVALFPVASVVAEGGKIERYREIREKYDMLIDEARAEVQRLCDQEVSEFSEDISVDEEVSGEEVCSKIEGQEEVKKFLIARAEERVKDAEKAEKAELEALGLTTRLLGGSAFYVKRVSRAFLDNKMISIPATLMVGIAGHLAYRNLISGDLTMDELSRVTKACFFMLGEEESINVIRENKVLAEEVYAFLGSNATVSAFGTLKVLDK